jgi:hypothetical protein
MRLVVDSNVLTEEALRDYLSKSKKNRAIVTDYLMIEALKGGASEIFRLMKTLCEFPDQVDVLKSMRSINALKGRRSGMTRRMIDRQQTKGFGKWCWGLKKAEAGDQGYMNELQRNGSDADAEIQRIVAGQADYAAVIKREMANFTPEELRILKADEPYTVGMLDKLADRIVSLTVQFLALSSDVRTPTPSELPYTYAFRLALCAYLQTLRRIKDGGVKDPKMETIANDIIDAVFAALGTYFQGLLTSDRKAKDLHRNAKDILKGFPIAPVKIMDLTKKLPDDDAGIKQV